jgi:hypothetical protein
MGGTSVVRDECVLLFLPETLPRGAHIVPRLSHKAAELSTELVNTAYRLCTEASEDTLFNLSLYPITLERSARLNQAAIDYEDALRHADQAYEEELNKLHEEWQTGRERVKERLLEGIEERRRRAREDKDGDGILNGASISNRMAC